MKKRIKIHKRKVEYTLKMSKRARRMRLAIYCDGNFVVTAPRGMDLNMVERFVNAKSRWIMNKLNYFKAFQNTIFAKTNKADFLECKQQAQLSIENRIRYFNKSCRFKFNKINIKNQKTRWGSCSKKGNLNFNYKIALLPRHIADYIVAHELCHLTEFSHSKKFWNLVENLVPNYLEAKKELRGYDSRRF